jgi:hypothetical protein
VSFYVTVFVIAIALVLCNGVVVARLMGNRWFRPAHSGAKAMFQTPPQEVLPDDVGDAPDGFFTRQRKKLARRFEFLSRRSKSLNLARVTNRFRRLPILIKAILKLLQNLSFAFLPAIRWNEESAGAKWVPDMARTAMLEFASIGLAPRFWVAAALSLLTIAVGSVVTLALAISSVRDNRPRAERERYPTRFTATLDEGDFWPWVARLFPFISADFLRKIPLGSAAMPILAGFVYNIALRVYLTVLDCVEVPGGGGISVLEIDPAMQCWTGEHQRYVTASMVLLTMHSLTAAVLFVAFLREFKPSDDVRMTGAYEILSRAVEALAIVLAVLLTRRPGIPLGFTLCSEAALWVWTTFPFHSPFHDPCPGFAWMRALISATHGLAAWAHVCTLVSAEVIKTGEGFVPTVMFVVGTVAVGASSALIAMQGGEGAGQDSEVHEQPPSL